MPARDTGRGPAEAATFRDFLFLQYQTPLGAAIASTPMFEALKSAVPDARVTVACGETVRQVLTNNPYVDRLAPLPDPVREPIRAALAFVQAFGGQRFDCVIVDSQNSRSKIALLSRLTHARLRAGYAVRKSILDHALDHVPGTSVIAANLRVLTELGLAFDPPPPRLFPSEANRAAAGDFLSSNGVAPEGRVVCFATQFSGGTPPKRVWSGARFAEVADRLTDAYACTAVFIGTQSEVEAIDDIRAQMRQPSLAAAGRFDILELAALMARAKLLVTLDTGPLHVARAVGTPAIVIARPWQPPEEWLPVGDSNYTLLMKDEVVARSRRDPLFDAPVTIDEITSEDVISAAGLFLK